MRAGGHAEERTLTFPVPPRADLLPARLHALDRVAAAAPVEGRRRRAAPVERHLDRLIDPARHLGCWALGVGRRVEPAIPDPRHPTPNTRPDRPLAEAVLDARDRRPQRRPAVRIPEQAE